MRQQLRECDLFFSSLLKLRPELPHPAFDVDLVFLQNMQETRASKTFRSRPNQHQRLFCPRLFASRIAKSAVEIENRFSILPNGNYRAELAELLEVCLEERFRERA